METKRRESIKEQLYALVGASAFLGVTAVLAVLLYFFPLFSSTGMLIFIVFAGFVVGACGLLKKARGN